MSQSELTSVATPHILTGPITPEYKCNCDLLANVCHFIRGKKLSLKSHSNTDKEIPYMCPSDLPLERLDNNDQEVQFTVY